ncbi:MAG TPA: ribosome-associated translation inhibitor RaiA [Flavobacteriaceae bacterium]|jgi:putative sigma-54 modulation protein|nr:ribosomal subunit interface protein [Flavobacteriaceae bacterium]HAT66269.1 ribosome-associated translation inhibitor RaiA [Flavobacteriaceae bacterium]|tara:strand:- start:1085 stop:1387 length:303 start_codon:yes stop_codon:yes gene_type:complete
MTVDFQFVKIPVSEALKEYTTKKLQKIETKYNWVIHTEVFFKIENDALGEKICEMELSLPGPKIFASSKEKNFEMAVKETISDIQKQLKKRKELTFRANH